MKLYELISFEPIQTSRNYNIHNDRTNISKNADMMGKGAFGKVYHHDSYKRLNNVRKTALAGKNVWDDENSGRKINPTDSPDKDGYLSFIKMVEQNNNPYFPKIHSLKIFRDKELNIFYDIDIEKLYPYTTDKILKNDLLIDSLRENMFNVDKYYRFNKFSIFDLVKHSFFDFDIIRDLHLLDAINKIKKVVQDSDKNLKLDIHEGNIMWRITNNIPQLVITDPIS